eukprot:TRINITY_DN12368_c0_g1_i3.p1 TRINITY_DN12368_c0_g1~~TRINITY_DN12368_c0_g1_i3.p1  ORF type:complete len:311 (+),score=68.40 TRINITY_DN12368_c0_g1_i3:151-1083(+)
MCIRDRSYLEPMERDINTWWPSSPRDFKIVISKFDVREVCHVIKQILQQHEDYMFKLRSIDRNDLDLPRCTNDIGVLFMEIGTFINTRYIPYFKLFSEFGAACRNLPYLADLIRRKQAEDRGPSFSSLLSSPTRALINYKAMAKRMLKLTPMTDIRRGVLKGAADFISEVPPRVDGHASTFRHLCALQRKLCKVPAEWTILTAQEKLVHQGTLEVLGREAHCVLLREKMLVLWELESGDLELSLDLDLRGGQLLRSGASAGNQFEVVSFDRETALSTTTLFGTESLSDTEFWINRITEQIQATHRQGVFV